MNPFAKAFSTITDGHRFFVVAEVDDTTAKRAAGMLVDESPADLAALVADALNLHAMPAIIARSGSENSQSGSGA